VIHLRPPTLDEVLGLSGDRKPEPSEEWLFELRDGLSRCDAVLSGYLVYECFEGERSEALLVEVASAPPTVETARALMLSLEESGAMRTALARAVEARDGTSAGFSTHYFTERDLDIVQETGVLVWKRGGAA
jgi:hypothetical protein